MSINNPIDRKIAILSPSVIVKNNEIIFSVHHQTWFVPDFSFIHLILGYPKSEFTPTGRTTIFPYSFQ